jgi:hypothetical protein
MRISSPNGASIIATVNSDGHYEASRVEYNKLLVSSPSVSKAFPVSHTGTTGQNAVSRAARKVNSGAAMAQEPSGLPLFTKDQRTRADQVRILHNSMSHPSDQTLIRALSNGVILGTALTATDVANHRTIYGPCLACIAGKATKPSYHSSKSEPAGKVGDKVHVDILIFHVASLGGYEYYLFSVDEFSGCKSLISLKSKYSVDLNLSFDQLRAQYKRYQHDIKCIQCDSEVNFSACNTYLSMNGIELAQVPPYQHAQLVERNVRTLNDSVRTALASLEYELPQSLYGELLASVVHNLNCLSTSQHPTLSPNIVFAGKKLDLTKRLLIPFGTLAMLHHAGKDQHKFEPRAQLGIVLGPSLHSYGSIRAYIFETKEVVNRSELTPLQRFPDTFPWPIRNSALSLSDILTKSKQPIIDKPKRKYKSRNKLRAVDTSNTHSETINIDKEVVSPTHYIAPSESPSLGHSPTREGVPTEMRSETPLHPLLEDSTQSSKKRKREETRSQKASGNGRRTKKTRADHPIFLNASSDIARHNSTRKALSFTLSNTDRHGRVIDMSGTRLRNKNIATSVTDADADNIRRSEREVRTSWKNGPSRLTASYALSYKVSIKQALDGDRAQDAREAIRDEINNMLSYKVGHYVHFKDIPHEERGNILHSFMFLKEKEKPDGSYDKTKARMVGNGATQKEHMYDLISSSTVALSTVFLLFNLASHDKAFMASYDVKGAFLNARFGPKDPAHYLRVNKQVTEIWVDMDPSARPFVDSRGELMLRLDKFIYGLKQAPYKFQLHLVAFLKKLGYVQQSTDECLFIKHDGDKYSIISTHVDDILQVATSKHLVTELHEALLEEYKAITFSDSAEAYIGMSVERSEDLKHITLTQKGLIDKILKKYLPSNDKVSSDPNSDRLFQSQSDNHSHSEPVDQKEYLGLVMSLMYLARLTRPDILLPVVYLSTRSHCCTQADMSEGRRICRYLAGTRDLGIHIHCTSLQVHCVCDASYKVHTDGRSHTGFIIALGSTLSYLHSRSAKQKLTALSSTDAEVIAMVECLKMAIWIRNVIRELHITPRRRIVMFQDNKSAIIMVDEDSKTKNSKHILPKITFAREQRKMDILRMVYLNTKEMTADMLTKPLHGETFRKHRATLLGLNK